MAQGNKPRVKKPAWDPLKAYDERAKAYQVERQREAKYNREQGADLPNNLLKQTRAREKAKPLVEQAMGGEYTTKHRSGQTRTQSIPQPGNDYTELQRQSYNLRYAGERATNDVIRTSLFSKADQIDSEIILAQENENDSTTKYINEVTNQKELDKGNKDMTGRAAAKKKSETETRTDLTDSQAESEHVYGDISKGLKDGQMREWDTDMAEDDPGKIIDPDPKLAEQAAARQERLDRRNARVEAKKLEGFPAKRFKANLENKPRTDIKDLFHKAK